MQLAGEPQQLVLDRSQFAQELSCLALRVPKQRCHEVVKALRGHCMERPRLKAIVHEPGQGEAVATRLILLADSVTQDSLPPAVQAQLGPLAEGKCELVPHSLKLDYSHLGSDQVLRKLLPSHVEPPSSYEAVGHIAHLNLRAEQLPYKLLIGQVLLDKNPSIKTVVNKVGAIESEFRVFTMELLAGEPRTETEVVQHGTRFRLDFAQVYWNSRLEAEHTRLVQKYFKRGDVVVDIMAGIGPFAVPAAQQGCQVYANDLNPASVRYMASNVALNHVGRRVCVFNMDGRAFVRTLLAAPPLAQALPSQQGEQQQPAEGQPAPAAAVDGTQASHQQRRQQQQCEAQGPPATAQGLTRPGMILGPTGGATQPSLWNLQDVPAMPEGFEAPPGGLVFDHAVMNLPASAVEFLDAFQGAFDPATWQGRALPLVHVYTFKPAALTQEDVIKSVEHYLGGVLDEEAMVHQVRDVAPNKLMLCVTFRVPKTVAFRGRGSAACDGGDADDAHQCTKRQRVDADGA